MTIVTIHSEFRAQEEESSHCFHLFPFYLPSSDGTRCHDLQFSSVTQSCPTLWPHEHTRFPCPSPSPGVYSNSCPQSRWCHPTISSSAALFSFCLQSFPASMSFAMSWLFASGGQSIGASTSASVLPVNIQGWFPLKLIGLISLQSKGLSRVFSSTTVQKYQLFGPQPSIWPNSHICAWPLEKLQLWLYRPFKPLCYNKAVIHEGGIWTNIKYNSELPWWSSG